MRHRPRLPWSVHFWIRRHITGRWLYRNMSERDRLLQHLADGCHLPDALRKSSDLNHWSSSGVEFGKQWFDRQMGGDCDER